MQKSLSLRVLAPALHLVNFIDLRCVGGLCATDAPAQQGQADDDRAANRRRTGQSCKTQRVEPSNLRLHARQGFCRLLNRLDTPRHLQRRAESVAHPRNQGRPSQILILNKRFGGIGAIADEIGLSKPGDFRRHRCHLRRDLVQRIQFRENNLASDMPPAGSFDLALCRNVLLYFSPPQRTEAFERIARALRPGGLLVLGASETVIGQTDRFRPSSRWRGLYERV